MRGGCLEVNVSFYVIQNCCTRALTHSDVFPQLLADIWDLNESERLVSMETLENGPVISLNPVTHIQIWNLMQAYRCVGTENSVFSYDLRELVFLQTDSISACGVLKQRYLSELLVCAWQHWYLQIGHCCMCDIFAQSGVTFANYILFNH